MECNGIVKEWTGMDCFQDWEDVDDEEDHKQGQAPSALITQGKDTSVFRPLDDLQHLLTDEVMLNSTCLFTRTENFVAVVVGCYGYVP